MTASRLAPLADRWSALPRWAQLSLVVIATRLWALGAMVLGTYFPRTTPGYWRHQSEDGLLYQHVPWRVLDVWGRWDSLFYESIAQSGYPPLPPDGGWAYHAAFFPLFPALTRGVSELLGGAPVFYVGLVVANAMLVLAVVFLDRLVRLDATPRVASLVVFAVLCYPGSHWYSCLYPESTALFLGVYALWAARTERPLQAGLACALAVLARSSGVFVSLAVLLELCRTPEGALRPRARALVPALPALALVALMAFHQWRYADPLYFAHVQAGWNRKPTLPLLALFTTRATPDHHLFTLLGLAAVGAAAYTRQRASYVALAAANMLLPLSTGLLSGVQRYMATNFPLFVFVGRWMEGRPWLRRAYFACGLVLLFFYALRWGRGRYPN